MKHICYFLLMLITFIIQTTFLNAISIEGITPNLMFIISVIIGFLKGEYDGLFVGCVSGLLHDIFFATSYIGGNLFLYGLIPFMVGIFCKEFYKGNVITPMIVVAISTFIFELGNYILIVLLSGFTNIGYYTFIKIIPSVVYNCIAMIFVYIIAFAINSKFERKIKHKRKVF